ncbi:MAG TPA: hypothetical protein PKY96_06520 [Flavobacteriales bacterium]|nr:hypothetical protein [Flavobacteriales bacterium]
MRALTIPFLLLFSAALHAQSIQVAAFNSTDSVVVRWAPASVQAWERFNRYGCRIERVDVSTNERTAIRLSTDTLRPMSLEQVKLRLKDNPHAPVVAQALYGAELRPKPGDLRAQMDAADQSKLRWSLCALYADIDPAIAQALGYRWVDKQVSASAHYLYRVINLDPERADTAMVGVDRKRGPDGVPAGPAIGASEQEGRIDIHWEAEAARLNFSAYWIERVQGNGAWQRLNSAPFVPMDSDRGKLQRFTWKDTTIAANYTPYRYRVLGITPFGSMSVENTVITAMGRDRTAPPSPEMKGVKEENGKLVVHWEQPEGARDLKGGTMATRRTCRCTAIRCRPPRASSPTPRATSSRRTTTVWWPSTPPAMSPSRSAATARSPIPSRPQHRSTCKGASTPRDGSPCTGPWGRRPTSSATACSSPTPQTTTSTTSRPSRSRTRCSATASRCARSPRTSTTAWWRWTAASTTAP